MADADGEVLTPMQRLAAAARARDAADEAFEQSKLSVEIDRMRDLWEKAEADVAPEPRRRLRLRPGTATS